MCSSDLSKCLSSLVRISRPLLSPPSVAPLMYVSLSFEVSVKKGFFFLFGGVFGVGFCGFCVFGLMGLFGLVRFRLGLLRISECKVFWVKTQKGLFFFLPGGIEFCGVLGVNGALKLFGLVRFQLGLLQIWEKVGGLSLSQVV